MKVRTLLLVMLALICGGSTAVGVSQLASQSRYAKDNTVQVVTAAVNVARGTVLTNEELTTRAWPALALPPGVVTDVQKAAGRTVLVPLVKGEPLMEAKLAGKDAGRGLAAMVPFGMRAFTIRTSHVAAGGGGFILPGDKVDVLLTMSDSYRDDETGGGSTTTLLQNIEVLAVAQIIDAPDSNKVDPKELTNVTLLVAPDQAAKLDLGMNKGNLHLSLRNTGDSQSANTRPATMAELRFDQEKASGSAMPWKELASIFRSMTSAAGKTSPAAVTDHGPAVKLAEARLPGPAPTTTTSIQTLRGIERGSIVIERR